MVILYSSCVLAQRRKSSFNSLSRKREIKTKNWFWNVSIHGKSSCLPSLTEYFSVFSTVTGGVEIVVLSRDCSVFELQIFCAPYELLPDCQWAYNVFSEGVDVHGEHSREALQYNCYEPVCPCGPTTRDRNEWFWTNNLTKNNTFTCLGIGLSEPGGNIWSTRPLALL